MASAGQAYGALVSSNSDLSRALLDALKIPEVDLSRGVALVGCGWVATEQLRSYSAAGVRVVGLHDRGRDKAVLLRDAYYPQARVYDSLDELLADPAVEIVDVTTHVEARPAIISRAIAAGKHVLSQKPFVEDLAVGVELQRQADAAGVILAVNQNGRWAPHFGALLACVASGLIGTVTSADFFVAWEHDTDVAARPAGELFSSMSDLVLFDFGSHWFDIVGALAPDDVLSVHAITAEREGQVISAPTQASVTIWSESFVSTLNFRSAERLVEAGSFRVSGTRGVVTFSGASLGGDQVAVATHDGTAVVHTSSDWFAHGLIGTLRELMRAIDSGDEPSNSSQSSLRGLALAFAANRSAADARAVVAGTEPHRTAVRGKEHL